MSVLTKYLIRVHLGPFLFALSAITAVIFLNSLSQRVGDLVGKGLPWTVIVEFLILSLPHVIALALPMAVLVSVLYAFNELAASNEVTALASGGVRPRQMMIPVVTMGVLAAVVMYYFNDKVLPDSNHALKNLILDIGRKSPTLELREQVVNELRPGGGSDLYHLTADRIDHESATLVNVAIYDANDPMRNRTTYAARGEMAFNAERTDLYLTLYDGVVHESQSDRVGGFQRLYFESQIVPLRGVGNELTRNLGGSDRSDREMNIAQLSENARQREVELDSLRNEARAHALRTVRTALGGSAADSGDVASAEELAGWRGRSLPPPGTSDAMTLDVSSEARSRAARGVALQQTVNRFDVEIHKKLAIAFACIVFALIGPSLALRFPRGGVGLVVAASTLIFSVYWVGLIAGENMADRRRVDPAVAMWMSNAVFLTAGIILAARMARSHGNTRGSGMGELWQSFLDKLRRKPARPAEVTR
ncbi:MAG: YjgP/YjgQ family permease [Gemmatimonadetes bacterium]|nr:YjgP/YjgQ family permease [Gemmatimonadota bacterium]